MSASEWLARRITFPCHERLRGRRTLAEMRALAELLRHPPDQVQALAGSRLRSLLDFAAEHLPFYTELFACHGLDLHDSNPTAALARLPVLRKAIVRIHGAAMTFPHVPGGLQPAVSGGTSGDTLHFYVDRLRQAQSMGARLFMQGLFGVRPGDRRMWIWGSPIEVKSSRLRHCRDRLINELVLDAFDLPRARVDDYLRRVRAYQPRLIIGYTEAVALLARRAAEAYHPTDFASLRAVVLTGDEVRAEHRAAVQAGFGCRGSSEYGSREVGLIAHECPRGQMHVLTPHIFVETTCGDRRLEAGVEGHITCTNLNSRAQPLIRYDVGDVGRISGNACDCGLPLPVLEITGGRVTNLLALPGGRSVHGHLLAYIARADPAVVEFRVYQRALDHLDVYLVVAPTFTRAVADRIVTGFARYLGPDVTVRCRVVKRIPPDRSGKRRHFVSDLPQAELPVEVR